MTQNTKITTAQRKALDYLHSRGEVVEQCVEIAEEYRGQGLVLTLRQMYYQLVARGLSPNGQRAYKRLGSILTDARYDGNFPTEYIEDRGREIHSGDFKVEATDVDVALQQAAETVRDLPEIHLGRSLWWGQPTHVSVWIEKEALSGIFQAVCDRLGVSWFACRGYPSVSALSSWLDEVARAESLGAEEAVVLYFGDHDPDGWEIPRSSLRGIQSLRHLQRHRGIGLDIRFDRIALNMNQIERFDPPPFPAKMTSARYTSYIDEHGTDEAWELDALDPASLRRLVETNVRELFDDEIADENSDAVLEARRRMAESIQDPDWISEVWA